MKKIHTFDKFNEASNFSREHELEDIYKDLLGELNDLEKEKAEIDDDMNHEAGEKGDKWNDDDANRYGDLLNKKDEEIEKKKIAVEKAKAKYYNYGSPRGPRDLKPGDASMRDLKANLEDVKRSLKSWPDRTMEEQAVIYKKRYKMGEDIPTIVAALNTPKTEKKI